MAATNPLTIERGIPAPSQSGRRAVIAALRAMEIGDSVLVPGKTARELSNCVTAAKVGHRSKYFECKTLTVGTRVWRLE